MPKSKSKRTPPSIPVLIELKGETYHGTYTVVGGMITVSTGFGSKTTQVGGTPVEALAMLLLSELVNEDKA
jgi:hypothetical protein